MSKTLNWIANKNDLFTLIGKDAYAIVEENNEKWASEKRWKDIHPERDRLAYAERCLKVG